MHESGKKLYALSPRLTIVATLISLIAVGVTFHFLERYSAKQLELKRLQNTSYSAQAQKLEETKSNLQTLLQFIEEERKKLALSEQAVSSLKREYDRIRPLIESDRKTINSILATQEARNQVAQITERWIGFGVASSLLA